jgi:protein PsiE
MVVFLFLSLRNTDGTVFEGANSLGAFYSSHRITITIPLVIAMTALSRLIILQGKDGDPSILLYESGAILMIAIACWVISKIQDRD